jgi:hypothetical protein
MQRLRRQSHRQLQSVYDPRSSVARDAITFRPARPAPSVALVNPLGAGLAHYTESLDHVLRTCGVSTRRVDVVEPSSAGYGKARWLFDYLLGVSRRVARDRPNAIVAAWPAVGYWDLSILAMLTRRPVYLVMHDPRPLVYARGYGVLARELARRQGRGAILAHSPGAVRTIAEEARMPRVFEALHPMLPPRQAPPPAGEQRNIRVLGQYKADRDVAGLERLAVNAPPEWRLEIIGRGWPSIDGWDICNEFVTETHFDELIRTSHVVLIPYSRFFQSGVAIRALEWGVPVVGPHVSSLRIALGEDCRWLVREGDWDWASAVAAAVDEDRDRVHARARDLYERVIGDWSKMLEQAGLC